MQADSGNSTGAAGGTATKRKRNIRRFDPARWLARWVRDGNSVELTSDGHLWTIYGDGPASARRDWLSIQLRDRGGVAAVKGLMAASGLRAMGATA